MSDHLNTRSARGARWRNGLAGCLAAVVLAACGGGDPADTASPGTPQPVEQVGTDGARVDVTPVEGLPPVDLSITRTEAGAPALPAGMQAAGPVYQFAPLGHVGSAIEIRVPFDRPQPNDAAPRLLIALAGDEAWSEIDAQLDGDALRARVPSLGYAVAVRPGAEEGLERQATSATRPAQYLRARLSAVPALQGGRYLLTASSPSTATIRLDYSFPRSCAVPAQIRLRALVARPRSSTQPFAVRTVELGSRGVTAGAGSERFDLPLSSAQNGTWVFVAEARCVEQGRVRFALLATVPVLVVKIPAPPPPSPTEGSATIGPAGGVVNGPDRVQLVVPAGALAETVTIRIARSAAGAPPLPEGLPPAITVYEITPHDLRFSQPVTVRLPFTGTPAPGEVAMVATPGDDWRVVPATASNGFVEIRRSSLSWYLHTYTLGCIAGRDDPFRCQFASIGPGGDITTDPPNAITRIPLGNGSVSDGITRAATLTIPVAVSAAGDCTNGRVAVNRKTSQVAIPQQILQQSLNLQPGPAGSGRVVGSFTVQTAVTAADNGSFDLGFFFECTRTFEGIVSRAFTGVYYPIRIEPPVGAPTITQQPANLAVTAGTTARFSLLASAANGLSVTWERSNDGGASWLAQGAGVGIAGGSALDVSTQLADNGARFRARVCNGSGPTRTCLDSSSATLTVIEADLAPVFTTQPADASVAAGQSASFTAVATGRPAPSIRWQAAPAGSSNFADPAGVAGCAPTAAPGSGQQTASTCTIGPLTVADTGRRLRAVASNAAAAGGVVSRAATVTVNAAPAAPVITGQPAPQSTTVGGSATFTVAVTGTSPLTYAWRVNGTPVTSPGRFQAGDCSGTAALSAGRLTLSDLSEGCNGASIVVVIGNGIGSPATSNPATLTVTVAAQGSLALLAGELGGAGTLDGTGSGARVSVGPQNGIAFDASGTAYFSNANVVRKVTPAGVVTTLAGATAPLRRPEGVAVDAAGHVYVAERDAHRILRIAPDGTSVQVWAGSVPGGQDGTGVQAQFTQPSGLALDAAGNLYVSEWPGFNAGRIRKISPTQGVSTLYTFGSGSALGAIAVALDGTVYGAGLGALSGTLQRISPAGVLSLVAGAAGVQGDVDGIGSAARFKGIAGLVLAANGDLYATDNRTVRRVTPVGEVQTVSGSELEPFVPRDGSGDAARYDFAGAIGRAPNGDLLIGDVSTLRRLTPGFELTTFIGKRLERASVDATGTAARFNGAGGVALDDAGNAYVAGDVAGIRRVTPAGVVTTLPATATPGSLTRFIARGAGGDFVVASSNALWRSSPSGALTLLAGHPAQSDYVDAPLGTTARFGGINGIAVDAADNTFVTETINGNATIRRITPAGEVTTWAGAKDVQPEVRDGDRLSARFAGLTGGLAFDASGNLYVTDFTFGPPGAFLIRRISPQGGVTTFVDAGAGLARPSRLAFEPGGGLLVGGDGTLQRVGPDGRVAGLISASSGVVRLGPTPSLGAVIGMAVRPDGRVVLTSEGAVLDLTLPP